VFAKKPPSGETPRRMQARRPHYAERVSYSPVPHILLFTLVIATISTIAIAPVALALAAWSWRAGTKGLIIDAIGALPLVLPPTAVGFVMLEILSRRSPVGAFLQRIGIEILFTPKAVVLACAVMSFPLMFTAFRVAIETSDRRYFDIARTLGVTPVRAFLRVTLPLAWRGLLSGMLLAFCRALGEFGATILIAGNIPGRTQTLALAIYDRVQNGSDTEAAMLVGWVVAMAWMLVVISGILIAQQRRRFAA
jgi:molybdate transport system permease protein